MKLDVLIVAPHPDDAELGMAGAILKMIAAGCQVGILDLTDGEPTPHGSVEIRARETAAATELLGVPWRENLGLPNRSLQATLEARADLANVIRRTRPRLLFGPAPVDAHPDHVAASQLVEAARFWGKLTKSPLEGDPWYVPKVYHYYSIHLRMAIQPSFVLDISQQWERKRQAIECYRSQFIIGRNTTPPTLMDYLRDTAAYWGHLIGTRYGEPFSSREPVGLKEISGLV